MVLSKMILVKISKVSLGKIGGDKRKGVEKKEIKQKKNIKKEIFRSYLGYDGDYFYFGVFLGWCVIFFFCILDFVGFYFFGEFSLRLIGEGFEMCFCLLGWGVIVRVCEFRKKFKINQSL